MVEVMEEEEIIILVVAVDLVAVVQVVSPVAVEVEIVHQCLHHKAIMDMVQVVVNHTSEAVVVELMDLETEDQVEVVLHHL